MATLRRSRRVAPAVPVALAALAAAAGCAGTRAGDRPHAPAAWHDGGAAAVSRPVTNAGVTAVTALGAGGRLRTLVLDTATGRPLWARTATVAGRPPVMGVAPPAVAGPPGRPVVVSVEPRGAGTAVVARDARTGTRRWSRPAAGTFGPQACGDAVCVTESTARANASFAVLDPATGAVRWRTPGLGEVEWADARRVVLFRMAAHPLVEARDPATGRRLWASPVEAALGRGVDLSGGWSFGALDGDLVGYVGPYAPHGGRPSASGFFALRLDDGRRLWARRRLLRVYPGADPAVAPIAREIGAGGRAGAFTQLDPRTGRTVARAPAGGVPATGRWPALAADLSALGLLTPGGPDRAYDLRSGRPLAGHVTAWSLCASPAPVPGLPGFRPAAALCPYDLMTGRRSGTDDPPPGWYTGAAGGWRVWRDERGGLHARHDANGTIPGMDG